MEIKPTLLRLSERTVEMLREQSGNQRRSMASLADEILYAELRRRKDEMSRLDKMVQAAGRVT